jgi:hypothetical protein
VAFRVTESGWREQFVREEPVLLLSRQGLKVEWQAIDSAEHGVDRIFPGDEKQVDDCVWERIAKAAELMSIRLRDIELELSNNETARGTAIREIRALAGLVRALKARGCVVDNWQTLLEELKVLETAVRGQTAICSLIADRISALSWDFHQRARQVLEESAPVFEDGNDPPF